MESLVNISSRGHYSAEIRYNYLSRKTTSFFSVECIEIQLQYWFSDWKKSFAAEFSTKLNIHLNMVYFDFPAICPQDLLSIIWQNHRVSSNSSKRMNIDRKIWITMFSNLPDSDSSLYWESCLPVTECLPDTPFEPTPLKYLLSLSWDWVLE